MESFALSTGIVQKRFIKNESGSGRLRWLRWLCVRCQVSNDGHSYSNAKVLTVYDGACQSCSSYAPATDVLCTLKVCIAIVCFSLSLSVDLFYLFRLSCSPLALTLSLSLFCLHSRRHFYCICSYCC